MITPRKIAQKTMTKEKSKTARLDFLAYYIGRPLTYVLTIPFLYLHIKPNTVSLISIIFSIIGGVLLTVGATINIKIIGAAFFFLWSMLDGVDGNIARYTGTNSDMGIIWDATSGYIAMIAIYLSMGFGCYYGDFVYTSYDKTIYVMLGGLSAIFIILPRLVMFRKECIFKSKNNLNDRASYSVMEIIILNVISTAGILQVFLFLSIIFRIMDIFTIVYAIINFLIMLVSLIRIFKE
jgi:phosphatidylglycerophosphate synthase